MLTNQPILENKEACTLCCHWDLGTLQHVSTASRSPSFNSDLFSIFTWPTLKQPTSPVVTWTTAWYADWCKVWVSIKSQSLLLHHIRNSINISEFYYIAFQTYNKLNICLNDLLYPLTWKKCTYNPLSLQKHISQRKFTRKNVIRI